MPFNISALTSISIPLLLNLFSNSFFLVFNKLRVCFSLIERKLVTLNLKGLSDDLPGFYFTCHQANENKESKEEILEFMKTADIGMQAIM
jgi:hypothetical protein